MAGYNDTRNLIIEALMGRQAGTEIQPEKHQAYALNMLDYVRSVELVSSSTLVGLAEESTVPIQPNQGKVCYIAGVGQDRTVTFSNFIDDEGNPISITTGEMEGVFVILLWNMEHWVAYTFNTNIISSAESANFYYGYNIRKTYESVAAMNADSVNPIGTDGRLIKIGELVTIVNSTTPAENGYYSYEGSENGWLLQSGFSFEIVQTTGTDINKTMSQKAVTDELALKADHGYGSEPQKTLKEVDDDVSSVKSASEASAILLLKTINSELIFRGFLTQLTVEQTANYAWIADRYLDNGTVQLNKGDVIYRNSSNTSFVIMSNRDIIEIIQANEANAIKDIALHNSALIFKGFASLKTPTPTHTLNDCWSVVETGTIFGLSAKKGDIIYSNGTNFIVEKPINRISTFKPSSNNTILGSKVIYDNASKKSKKTLGKNLYDKNSDGITHNKFLNSSGLELDNADFIISNYIPIASGQTLTINRTIGSGVISDCLYDINGEYIGSQLSDVKTITALEDGYVRFSIKKSNVNVQVEEGSTSTPYEEYTEHYNSIQGQDIRQEVLSGILEYEEIVNRFLAKKGNQYPSVNYPMLTGSLVYNEYIRSTSASWVKPSYFIYAKLISDRAFNKIGLFLSPNEATTADLVVKLWRNSEIILDTVIPNEELPTFPLGIPFPNTDGAEILVDLNVVYGFKKDDVLCLGVEFINGNNPNLGVYWDSIGNADPSLDFGLKQTIQGSDGQVVNAVLPPAVPSTGTIRAFFHGYLETTVSDKTTKNLPLTAIPKKIYTVQNNIDNSAQDKIRAHSIPFYIDHCLSGLSDEKNIFFEKSKDDRVLLFSPKNLDNGLTITHGNTETYTKTFKVSGDGFNSENIIIEQKSTLESVGKTLFPKILTIGDSTVGGTLTNVGVPEGFGNQFWSVAKEQFERAKIEDGYENTEHNALFIGKAVSHQFDLKHKGVTKTVKSFAEGAGGWCSSDHMYHADQRLKTQATWDLLGLGNGTGTDYTGSVAQRKLIDQTGEGVNAPINTAAFINYMATTYGVTADYASAKAKADDLLVNPINPFFDTAKVGVKFSIKKYLDRYKTLDNDGVTRLTVGTTAGTKVVDVNAYDICLPTHLFLQHGHNEEATSTWFAENMRLWTSSIKNEYIAEGWAEPIIGISLIDFVGTYFPSRYPELQDVPRLWDVEALHRKNQNYYNQLIDEFWVDSANEDTEKIFILPSMFIQPTAWAACYRSAMTPEWELTGYNKHAFYVENRGGAAYHPSGICNRNWGISMYAWLRYTLSL